MKIKIHVTREIIDRSSMCSVWNEKTHCAVALAIRDLFPNAIVYQSGMIFYEERDYSLPPKNDIYFPGEIFMWIKQFDCSSPEQRLSLAPISFDIDVPHEVIEKIGIGEAYKILSESKTLELVSIN